MDSAVIAAELEARYPTPSLRLDSKLEAEAQSAMGEVFQALVPLLMPAAPNLVAPADLEWFKTDRAARFHMTVEEAFDSEKDGRACYAAARHGFERCAELLRRHKLDQGPFILGSEPCYADFYLVSTMQMLDRAGKELFAYFVSEAPPEMITLHEACQQWTTRQD